MSETKMNFEKAFKDLIDVKKILDKNGILFWLNWGTLLGAIRDNDFIDYDGDINLGVYFEDSKKILKSVDEFKENGFNCSVDKINTNNGEEVISVKLRRNESIDIFSFIKIINKRICIYEVNSDTLKIWINQDHSTCSFFSHNFSTYFDNLDEIVFGGERFRIPSNAKKLLSQWYGKLEEVESKIPYSIKNLQVVRKEEFMNSLNGLTRWDFFNKIINENGYKNFVEVGICEGEMASNLIKNDNINPYIMIDNEPKIGFYDFFRSLENKIKKDREYSFMRIPSVNASRLFADNSLDVVFIDANHSYETVLEDIKVWYPKVRKGGVISGHDYEHPSFGGVKMAVDEFFGDINESFNLDYDKAGEAFSVKIWWKKI